MFTCVDRQNIVQFIIQYFTNKTFVPKQKYLSYNQRNCGAVREVNCCNKGKQMDNVIEDSLDIQAAYIYQMIEEMFYESEQSQAKPETTQTTEQSIIIIKLCKFHIFYPLQTISLYFSTLIFYQSTLQGIQKQGVFHLHEGGVAHSLPRPERVMEDMEEKILEDIYRDIDKINMKIKLPRERDKFFSTVYNLIGIFDLSSIVKFKREIDRIIRESQQAKTPSQLVHDQQNPESTSETLVKSATLFAKEESPNIHLVVFKNDFFHNNLCFIEYKQASEMPPSFFKYAFVDGELVSYMKELLGLFSAESQGELCVRNKNFMINRIQAKLKDHGVIVEDKDFIGINICLMLTYLFLSSLLFVWNIEKRYFEGIVLELIRIVHEIVQEENAAESDVREKDLFLYIIASAFLKVGIEAYTFEENSLSGWAAAGLQIEEESRSLREAGVLSEAMWVVMTFVYIADSGLNYRRYQRGLISPSEFWTQTSLLSLTTLEGLAGSAGGVALGFTLGTMLLPGVGSLIGTVVGGLAGGLAGDKLMLRQYQDLENRLDHLHLIMQSQIMPSQSTDEAYKEALLLLNSNENDELLTIENRFFEKQHYISEQLFSAKKAKNELLSKLQHNELESLYEAYKIVRSRKHYVSTKEGAGAETSSLTEAFKME